MGTKCQAKLSAGGDDAWKEREDVVLALGAIGEGCINGLYPHLLERRKLQAKQHRTNACVLSYSIQIE
ncbi:hypothetical protein LR48_Vigan01g158400 [Vigna angularis]|uniref:Uncharacterized protein n=1 Tax=Phaseolus angularis TaxID=3914 RepID=A0A0L9TN83_PHAAN|nr:hypothetical protein LR48_Vigan01g158400 [Vigna angularis]